MLCQIISVSGWRITSKRDFGSGAANIRSRCPSRKLKIEPQRAEPRLDREVREREGLGGDVDLVRARIRGRKHQRGIPLILEKAPELVGERLDRREDHLPRVVDVTVSRIDLARHAAEQTTGDDDDAARSRKDVGGGVRTSRHRMAPHDLGIRDAGEVGAERAGLLLDLACFHASLRSRRSPL
jgi:hypothetical protein